MTPNDAGATTRVEVLGWPPNRATSMAVSAFVANQRLILSRVQAGECITLTQRQKEVAALVPCDRIATLEAQLAAALEEVERLRAVRDDTALHTNDCSVWNARPCDCNEAPNAPTGGRDERPRE